MILTVAEISAKFTGRATEAELGVYIAEAESLIAVHTMGRSTQTQFLDTTEVDVIKEAIIDQIDYWLYVDPNMDMINMPQSVKVGNMEMQYKFSELAPRAKRHLQLKGLLSRKIKLR